MLIIVDMPQNRIYILLHHLLAGTDKNWVNAPCYRTEY